MDRDDGFSLIELLVVMVLFGVIGGVVTNAIFSTLRSAAVTSSRIEAQHELELGLQRITRDLRAASPIVLSAGGDYDTEVGATISREGDVSTVSYLVTEVAGEQRLVREDSGRTLVSFIDNGDVPVFRYLDPLGNEISCTDDCDTAYLRARQIEIRLVRAIDDRPPVEAETRVNIRNLRHGSAS